MTKRQKCTDTLVLDFILDEEKCTAIPQIIRKMIPTNQMFNFTVEDRGGHQVLFTRDHVKYNKFGQITSFYDVKEYLISPKLLQELKEKKEKELIAKKERKDYRLKSLKCISKSTDYELAITSEDPKRIFSYRKCY